MSSPDRNKQMAEAEAILGDRLSQVGFAKGLYFGHYLKPRLGDYPDPEANPVHREMAAKLKDFCRREIDPVAIDRNAKIPESVIHGLGELGVLGACLPVDCGGRGLSQTAYCRLVEQLGGHCGSTALFVNAHHSIGPRSIVLFGNAEQQRQWLPKLASGEWISAFALTEPEAGSDAANVQTMATPTPNGQGFKLNGEKRWITNGGIAKVLTVMARTPVEGSDETRITAFIVTPDMPGFEVVEARMEKCGVRGTATSRLKFNDMFVPRENILGKLGGGLRVALTVLDFGRTTFGASCTGAAKFCVARAIEHANRRVQFGQKLGEFELVKEKLAYMAAGAFAMESVTYQTAALIDSGEGDYMIETAMLKVFSTEVLWRIITDTFQIHGGLAYFTDQPFERMMRDARINTIGEGANDVLRAFIALVGMRDVGLELKGIFDALLHPWGNLGRITGFAGRKISSMLISPKIEVRHEELSSDAARLGRLIGELGGDVARLLARHREGIVDRQYLLARVADAATELYVSACVLNRLDSILDKPADANGDLPRSDALAAGQYYLQTAARRIRQGLYQLSHNDDEAPTSLADRMLG
ncbi:MAG: acyl-CoA dehydrogenase family protein [Planctomycetes bacterium]|nr:acyl-CoA dehydrogenase family protein [Planctomycetota bacterium]